MSFGYLDINLWIKIYEIIREEFNNTSKFNLSIGKTFEMVNIVFNKGNIILLSVIYQKTEK